MNSGAGGSSGGEDLPQFKNFISENEIEEKKRIRQEEWEKVRTEDQPLEAPEEEYDHRSLYERLQEQKDKKQEEYEAQFKAKNQVRGIDDDEAGFLEFVSDRTQELTKQRELEDFQVIREYKNALVTKASDPGPSGSSKPTDRPKLPSTSQNRKSQSSMLMGAVKRKGSATETSPVDEKKVKLPNSEKTSGDQSAQDESETSPQTSQTTSDPSSTAAAAQIVGILPGMGAYTDSSDTDSNSSSSDIDVSTFKRQVKAVVCSQSGGSNH